MTREPDNTAAKPTTGAPDRVSVTDPEKVAGGGSGAGDGEGVGLGDVGVVPPHPISPRSEQTISAWRIHYRIRQLSRGCCTRW